MDRAGITGGTNPGCFGTNNPVLQTEVSQNHNPPGRDVRVFAHGASAGTGTTLHALVKILAAEVFDFLDEFFIIGVI